MVFVQVDQKMCTGCGACLNVCAVGAIRLVDDRATIDENLCTACRACVEACPNKAIAAVFLPSRSVSNVTKPSDKNILIPTQNWTTIPKTVTPAQSLKPLAGAALAFLRSELRGRFIIDPDGIVQAMEVLTPPVGRKFSESVRQIQAFQHVRATGGKEATPAGWEPGKLTLRPGPNLVGKVWEVWKPEMEV
jgi:NAD-dependent dihydropyrimidine dehydrogenase PreA subunit